MLSAEEVKRYARHTILPEIGEEGQLRLKRARVLVIGAGGLGCPVLQYLNAAGVGTIGIIDDDRVDLSNLQRQILFSTADVGRQKATCAAEKLQAANPHTILQAYTLRLDRGNALGLFAKYDVIVDGTDNFATRYLVNDACVISGKPLVFGSIFKFEGQVSVFNYEGGPTYRCLYPEPPAAGEAPACAEIGVLGVLPGLCGALMANEVIKIITGAGEVLSGRLLCFDTRQLIFHSFTIEAIPANRDIIELGDYESFCGVIPEINAAELKRRINEKADFQLIDVREEAEYRARNIGGTLMPLNSLAGNLDRIDRSREVIVHCATGVRSKKAARLLRESGFTRVYSLRNGLLDF
jgi:sulfur-carrier protein adenylyltransferase/sulfurtransferase